MKAIMVMFDSLNRKMLSPYGCDWTLTPNFQRLSKKCVQFENCYAGSLPCMPARRELHTGRYNFLHRSWGPVEPYDDSMPEILKEKGIYTHLISDHTHYWEDGGATYHTRYSSWENVRGQEGDPWKVQLNLMRNNTSVQNKDARYFPVTKKMHLQDKVNRKYIKAEADTPIAKVMECGLEFLDANHQEDSWFLQIECFDPHEPFYAPESYRQKYADNYTGEEFDWPPYHHVTEDASTCEHVKNEYAALLTMCDTYLGKILDCMDRYEMWEDTMLIVNTDHGYLLGEHGWWSKGCMPWYDELVHIPLFIHDPRFSQMDGQKREEIVQTIDLPASLMEFFQISLPKDMQGRPVRKIIEEDQPIRDYALFGVHGGHVNIFDGRYVYMKAPVNDKNEPLYEYTLMPTHMRGRFSISEISQSQLSKGFSFTKESPLLKIPKYNGVLSDDFGDKLMGETEEKAAVGNLDNNSLTNAANFGDKLFDMESDPLQERELQDLKVEAKLANLMIRAMRENDAPLEQYERLGLKVDEVMTEKDIEVLHKCSETQLIPDILPEYVWERAAVNAYKALMRFVKKKDKESAAAKIKDALQKETNKTITCEMVLRTIPLTIPSDYCDMIHYFVSMSGRSF